MDQHKILIVSFIVITTVIGLFWLSTASTSTTPSSTAQHYSSSSVVLSKRKERINPDQSKDRLLITHQNGKRSIEKKHKDIPSSNELINPFEEEDIDLVSQSINKIKGVEPVAAVRMQQGMLKDAKIGDKVLLPPIDGISYEMKIETKHISQRGTVSIEGDFIENGITYTAVVSEGKKATFVSMYAPTGTYEINIVNGLGYIYLNTDIEKAKIDYSVSDEIEPPHNNPSEDPH